MRTPQKKCWIVISAATILITCCFLNVASGSATGTRTNWATDAYLKNRESVVFIQGDKVDDRRGGIADPDRTFNGMGSGIVIDERGFIITNYHVVRDIRQIQVKTYSGQNHIATIVAKDADTDLALIRINPRTPLQPIALGRSHDLMPGEVVMAIGNPYGYVHSLTDGRISAINRDVEVNGSTLVYRGAIQTNTEINPGNSGGPLININGEMIGINVAIRQGATGIAFATPVDLVLEVAAKLMREVVSKEVVHGITVSQIEPSDFHAIQRFIIRVESVENNSPAARAGIQRGDILTGIGRHTLRNKLDFYRALLDLRANEDVAFSLFRNNEILDIAVTIGSPRSVATANRNVTSQPAASAPRMAQPAAPAPSTAPRDASPRTAGNAPVSSTEWDRLVWENFGIEYAVMSAQEFERTYRQFLSDFDGGIVVRAVREGSPAELTGLIAGDLLAGIGPWATTSANDIRFIGGQEWSNLRSEHETLPADVIRDSTHYRAEIPMRVR